VAAGNAASSGRWKILIAVVIGLGAATAVIIAYHNGVLSVITGGKAAIRFSDSPAQVVKAFYMEYNEGKYSEVDRLLSADVSRAVHGPLAQARGGFKGLCDFNTRNGTITRIDVISEEIRGEGATVIVRIRFRDGSVKENDRNLLIRENGGWKLTGGD